MKICLDATYSLDTNPSGVSVYSQQILNGLAAQHPETKLNFAYRPHRYVRSFSANLPSNATRRLLWHGNAGAADLFHGLNQRIDAKYYRRTVSTFHDLFVLSGDYSTPEFRERFAQQARDAAERSDLIIAVSQFTANQVHELLHVDRSRLRVIHHGVKPVSAFSNASREPLILSVGAIQRRKNIARLIEAFEAAPPNWKLVLAGSQGFGAETELSRLESSPRKHDIQLLGYTPEAELESLYRRASIFVFPSLDEGFGMPILDAMAQGVPVLTSNCSAMAEVAGDAAILIDPHHTESIAAGLRDLTANAELRAQLAQKGLARSKEFSWGKAVEETWKVYQELIG